MKVFYTLLLAILLILPACNRDERVRAGGETTEQMKDQRDQYIRSIEAKLDEFDQKFDGLDARAAALSEPARAGFKNAVDSLRDQRRAVTRKLDDLRKVSLDSWQTLRGDVDNALAELENSYQKVSAAHETGPARH